MQQIKFCLLFLCGGVALLLLFTTGPSMATIGQRPKVPESTFRGAGVILTDFSPDSVAAYDLGRQSDRKLVAVGSLGSGSGARFLLIRYMPDGTLDTTFGENGIVVTDVGKQSSFAALEFQWDGKIVAGGEIDGTFAILRYNEDGSLDTTFGMDGMVTPTFNEKAFIRDLFVHPAGQIIAVGTVRESVNEPGDIGVVRLDADGNLDPILQGSGQMVMDLGGDELGEAITVQNDGRLIIAASADNDYAVVRTLSFGTLDPSFNVTGVSITDFGGDDSATDVLVQLDAKILAVGNRGLLRLETDGTLDPSFGNDGRVIEEFSLPGAMKITSQNDGKLVVFGSNNMVRYLIDGSRDPSFGSNPSIVGNATGLALPMPSQNGSMPSYNNIVLSSYVGEHNIALNFYDENGKRPAFLPLLVRD